MGRQVNFYMLGNDEREFVDFVLSDAQVVMLGEPCLEQAPRIIAYLPTGYSETLWQHFICFWNTRFYFKTRFTEIQKEGPSKGMYGFDHAQAPVIEFMRCALRRAGETIPYTVSALETSQLQSDITLGWGRIWADMYRLEGNQSVYKGDEFARWYERLARWIRRKYRRLGNRYIGPQAYQWYQSGGRLSEGI